MMTTMVVVYQEHQSLRIWGERERERERERLGLWVQRGEYASTEWTGAEKKNKESPPNFMV